MHKMVEQCTICQSSPVHAWRVNTTAINFYRLKTLSQLVTEIKEQQKEKTQTHVKSYFSMFFFLKQQISSSPVLNTFGYGLVCLQSHS